MIATNHSPLLQAIKANADKHPSKLAVCLAGGEEVTYIQLVERINSTAAYLHAQGLKQGDRIAISAQKDLEFIYVYFAAHALGVINIVVDAESNRKKLDYILDLMQPRVAFGFDCTQCRCINYKDITYDCDEVCNASTLTANDVADLIFTTGTTGQPKGVQLSHANIFGSADNINHFIGNTENEIEVLGLPLCHSFGLGRLRCTLIKSATMVLVGNFANLKLFFNAIEQYNATGFGMVPAVWAYIRKFSGTRISKYAPQIKYIEIGSAAMPLPSKEELCELFPNTRICMHYGLTEASRSAFMEFHECRDRLGTIGKPVCDKVDIRIFDDNGKELPDGESGELCVKGNMVMSGYYQKEADREAWFGDFFRTGDCGYRDSDGWLYLVSRKKEIINIGGKKVSPVEIEDAINLLDGVEDCICIGVEDPDGVLGEVAKCYVQREGCTLSLEEIRHRIEGKLEAYKIPVQWEWIDEIPKTSSGKKQRLQLKK
jgi:long-chain acyl-CoA synthetase